MRNTHASDEVLILATSMLELGWSPRPGKESFVFTELLNVMTMDASCIISALSDILQFRAQPSKCKIAWKQLGYIFGQNIGIFLTIFIFVTMTPSSPTQSNLHSASHLALRTPSGSMFLKLASGKLMLVTSLSPKIYSDHPTSMSK